jgi:hypothetical protein
VVMRTRSVRTRLAVFALAAGLAFGAGLGLGAAVGPVDERAPRTDHDRGGHR